MLSSKLTQETVSSCYFSMDSSMGNRISVSCNVGAVLKRAIKSHQSFSFAGKFYIARCHKQWHSKHVWQKHKMHVMQSLQLFCLNKYVHICQGIPLIFQNSHSIFLIVKQEKQMLLFFSYYRLASRLWYIKTKYSPLFRLHCNVFIILFIQAEFDNFRSPLFAFLAL